MLKLVTLTTDWRKSDFYIGAVKATILSKINDTTFVDISHNIEQHNWLQAGFILKSVIEDFPDDTIHIVAVNSEPGPNEDIILAKYHNQYFIGTDNGTFGIIFDEKPDYIIAFDIEFASEGYTFVEKNVFAAVAKLILLGKDLKKIGREKTDIVRYNENKAQIFSNIITGKIIYFDSFGNAISNIEKKFFDSNTQNAKFEILINSNYHKSNIIHKSYKEVEQGEIICVFNSLNLLEIAIREGNAKNLLGLTADSEIRIKIER